MQPGLRPNLGQFSLLATITFGVGLVVGAERVVVPVLAKQDFGVASFLATLSFIISFGFVKAALNLVAGRLADRFGRKPLLVLGWVIALPVPFMIIFAPSWGWVVAANVLLGMKQGLAWTMTVTGKIDLVGPRQRGFALGINEFSGYAGVSLGGFAGGYLGGVSGLRVAPFLFVLGVILVMLLASGLFVRETQRFTYLETQQAAAQHGQPDAGAERAQSRPSLAAIFALTTWATTRWQRVHRQASSRRSPIPRTGDCSRSTSPVAASPRSPLAWSSRPTRERGPFCKSTWADFPTVLGANGPLPAACGWRQAASW